MGQDQLDAHARTLGFPDYATWVAWNRHRSESLRNSHTITEPPPANFLQKIMGPLYPPTMLKYVSKNYGDATGAQP